MRNKKIKIFMTKRKRIDLFLIKKRTPFSSAGSLQFSILNIHHAELLRTVRYKVFESGFSPIEKIRKYAAAKNKNY